jgi:hypothetical protein
VAVHDVARVIAEILANPKDHIHKVYELTGPKSQDLNEIAGEYSDALGTTVSYENVPFDEWRKNDLDTHPLPSHVAHHMETMAKLHAQDRYNRFTSDVQKITGTPAMSVTEYVKANAELFRKFAHSRN